MVDAQGERENLGALMYHAHAHAPPHTHTHHRTRRRVRRPQGMYQQALSLDGWYIQVPERVQPRSCIAS
jgi:hypothetical protein